MGTKLDLINKKFDSLAVIREHDVRHLGQVLWVCLCDCGKELICKSSKLLNTSIFNSCGCHRDLVGKRFNRLTVISQIIDENKVHNEMTWLCLCDCGNTTRTTSKRLKKGLMSCGCAMHPKRPQEDLVGKKFGKLTVIKECHNENRTKHFNWECLCDCGNTSYPDTNRLKSGHTTSCGCVMQQTRLDNCAKGRAKQTSNRMDPREVTARWVHKEMYSDGDISFEQFMEMSQKNCFYCDIEPQNFSRVKHKDEKYSKESKFNYNGLDRVDSDKRHNLDNVVTCCANCNYAKMNNSFEHFTSMFKKVYLHERKELHIPNDEELKEWVKNNNLLVELPTSQRSKFYPNARLINSLEARTLEKRFYGRHAKDKNYGYNDGDLSFHQFCWFVKQNCHYCGGKPSNKAKYKDANGQVSYIELNGIDRKDNNLPHNLSNCVPCCKFCNYSKRKRTVEEFLDWNEKVYLNLKNKGIL